MTMHGQLTEKLDTMYLLDDPHAEQARRALILDIAFT